MTKLFKRIIFGIGECLFLALLTLIAPLCVFLDAVVFGHGISEISVTEFVQEGLLLISVILFGYGAWRHADSRGFFILGAGFFGCMLIRELDAFFDYVTHGFWIWPAIMIAFGSIGCVVLFFRDSVWKPMADFIDTKPYFHMMFGLVIVLVFSRIFGSRAVLLRHLDAGACGYVIKAPLQEGLELLGYIFIAYGAGLLIWSKRIDLKSSGKP